MSLMTFFLDTNPFEPPIPVVAAGARAEPGGTAEQAVAFRLPWHPGVRYIGIVMGLAHAKIMVRPEDNERMILFLKPEWVEQ